MTARDEAAWDEWEDDDEDALLSSTERRGDDHGDEKKATTETSRTMSDLLSSDDEAWGFDVSELEHEMTHCPPAVPISSISVPDDATCSEQALLRALHDFPEALRATRERVQTLEALALVTQMHLVAARASFGAPGSDARTTEEEWNRLEHELTHVAGEWGNREPRYVTTSEKTQGQKVREIMDKLQDALSIEDDDLAVFVDALAQVFHELPNQELRVSTTLLRPATDSDERETKSYVKHLVALTTDARHRIPSFSEAEICQDAKDIGRDEMVINGTHVHGQSGYDAVLDALEREFELVLARHVGRAPQQTPMAVSHALQSIAMTVLHASNRTESGGRAFELLRRFLCHDRILLRPASARAPPLQVQVDVGPYVEQQRPVWAFGLRVQLVAVTWYLVCDARDPSRELQLLETTYCTRLAFPVGLTPFHALETMRYDPGDVRVHVATTRADARHA
ncbi:hypothetical protein PsorP6_015396 [Peronosclerospora sorghi]|uniref:Uncharacterized protein n=1 Tax=Peronosclerospora sorghi TaxID=230839 RepID=A0ACC0WPC3_9STRA|nr:hypothetical protein PsorP6_015396 [Peronosclerospora sorghi]